MSLSQPIAQSVSAKLYVTAFITAPVMGSAVGCHSPSFQRSYQCNAAVSQPLPQHPPRSGHSSCVPASITTSVSAHHSHATASIALSSALPALLAPQRGLWGTALITQRNCLSLEGIQRKTHVIAGYPDVQGLWEGGWPWSLYKDVLHRELESTAPRLAPGAGCGLLCAPTGLRGPDSTSWSMME